MILQVYFQNFEFNLVSRVFQLLHIQVEMNGFRYCQYMYCYRR